MLVRCHPFRSPYFLFGRHPPNGCDLPRERAASEVSKSRVAGLLTVAALHHAMLHPTSKRSRRFRALFATGEMSARKRIQTDTQGCMLHGERRPYTRAALNFPFLVLTASPKGNPEEQPALRIHV